MKIEKLKDKKILILGMGREGMDTYKFLRKIFPKKIIGIGDRDKSLKFKSRVPRQRNEAEEENEVFFARQNSKLIRWHLGEKYLQAIKNYDIIIKSPGIPIHLPEIEEAFKEGKITSQMEIFFENAKGIIVGITGTKGKSTTTALIYKILKEGNLKAHLAGNIGKPVLSLLSSSRKNDIYVFEMSCHQLYRLKKSPHIAVLLNIFPEHLDYYKNYQEYIEAKANITKWQTKDCFLVYDSENEICKKIAQKTKAKIMPLNAYLPVSSAKKLKTLLIGDFNQKNIGAAVCVGKILGVNDEKIFTAIKKFKPLPYRLENIGVYKGITFYNDALSTIPETTIGAINALKSRVETIMLGGYDRNISFENLAREIVKTKIKNLIFFPTTGEKIWREIEKLEKKSNRRHFFVQNMNDAVRIAFENTSKGKICLLSCAATSFSIFRDYKEKGDLFKKYVKRYGKERDY